LGAQEFIRNDGLFFVQTRASVEGMLFESLGASVCQRPPTQDARHCVERFLFMSGSDLRGKVNALGGYTGPEAYKLSISRFESLQVLIAARHGCAVSIP
jgi:hypothetical protein